MQRRVRLLPARWWCTCVSEAPSAQRPQKMREWRRLFVGGELSMGVLVFVRESGVVSRR